jgi:hypothetical protein
MIGLVEPWSEKFLFLDAKLIITKAFHGNFDATKS